MTRVKLAVFVDLDPTPGQFHTAESARNTIHGLLGVQIPHYNPLVSIESWDTSQDPDFYDFAIEITRENMDLIAGRNDGQIVKVGNGKHYFIISMDPKKQNLVLPARIFKQCFMFFSEEKPGQFTRVQEI